MHIARNFLNFYVIRVSIILGFINSLTHILDKTRRHIFLSDIYLIFFMEFLVLRYVIYQWSIDC